MSVISMKQLLEAGVHFGHQTRRWNPKMAEYIFTERQGIYIIDLQKTVKKMDEAYDFVRQVAMEGGNVLFVGTKKQAQDAIKEEAQRAGMYFVNARWPGGMLTNFKTIKKSINRLNKLEKMDEDGTFDLLPKKEVLALRKEIDGLEHNLGGIKHMEDLPACVFIVDPHKERNAVLESRKLGIPVVAIVDTNCDPDEIDYIIPGNDDAIRAIRLIAASLADAVIEGHQGEQFAEEEGASADDAEPEEEKTAEIKLEEFSASPDEVPGEIVKRPVKKPPVKKEVKSPVAEEPAEAPAEEPAEAPAEEIAAEEKKSAVKKAAKKPAEKAEAKTEEE